MTGYKDPNKVGEFGYTFGGRQASADPAEAMRDEVREVIAWACGSQRSQAECDLRADQADRIIAALTAAGFEIRRRDAAAGTVTVSREDLEFLREAGWSGATVDALRAALEGTE